MTTRHSRFRKGLALFGCASLFLSLCVTTFSHTANAQAVRASKNTSSADELPDAKETPNLLRKYTVDPIAIQIVLPEMDTQSAQSLKSTAIGMWPPQIGLSRPIPSEFQGDLAGLLTGDWVEVGDGSMVAAISIRSKGASALRIGFTAQVKTNVEIRFFNPNILAEETQEEATNQLRIVLEGYTNDDFVEVDAKGEATLQWSPTIEGDSIALELRVQKTALPNFSFEIEDISHIFVPLHEALAHSPNSACNTAINVMCRVDTIPLGKTLPSSVAKILVSSTKGTFLCSGSLINDTIESSTPYFLTARHCVSNLGEARSVELHWMFQTERCDGGKRRDPRYTVTTGGGDLLRTRSEEDSTLLKLRKPPPSEAWFAGWSASRIAEKEWVFGIHHPRGMLKNYSLGLLRRYEKTDVCEDPNRRIGCFTLPNALKVPWGDGFSAGGSSGSPLFFKHYPGYIIGVLSGGPDDNCSASYGPFYQFVRHVEEWLWPDKPPRMGRPPYCYGDQPIGDHCP